MMKLNPYLMFSGNCREALNFYKEQLDGEIISDADPGRLAARCTRRAQARIFNSHFRAGDLFSWPLTTSPTTLLLEAATLPCSSPFQRYMSRHSQLQSLDRIAEYANEPHVG